MDENCFTALVMYGGGHWKGVYGLLKSLMRASAGKKVQIVVINGKDKRSYKKVARLQRKIGRKANSDALTKIVNVGFTDCISEYLASADVAVTKCGGVSSAEMINAELPMLVTQKIPAQELYNLRYLADKGAAIPFKSQAELQKAFDGVYSDPNVLSKMRERARALKTDALKELGEFILELPNADYAKFIAPDCKRVSRLAGEYLKVAYHNEKNAERN